MEGLKITFFRDKKITKGYPGALLEFSTGENKVVAHRNTTNFIYYISKAISDVIRSKKDDSLFEDLSNEQ